MIKKWIKKIPTLNSSAQESPKSSDQSNPIQGKGMEAGAPRLGLFKRLMERMGKTRNGFV